MKKCNLLLQFPQSWGRKCTIMSHCVHVHCDLPYSILLYMQQIIQVNQIAFLSSLKLCVWFHPNRKLKFLFSLHIIELTHLTNVKHVFHTHSKCWTLTIHFCHFHGQYAIFNKNLKTENACFQWILIKDVCTWPFSCCVVSAIEMGLQMSKNRGSGPA